VGRRLFGGHSLRHYVGIFSAFSNCYQYSGFSTRISTHV
jgi:hypothetical protein